MPMAKIGDLGLATRDTDSADIKGFAGTVHTLAVLCTRRKAHVRIHA
jgi:hypothetical protein